MGEDGLGNVSVVMLKLPSKRVVVLREFEQLIESRGLEHSLEVAFDATEVAALGVEPLISEVLEHLELSKDAVDWLAPAAAQNKAADLVQHLQNLYGISSDRSQDH